MRMCVLVYGLASSQEVKLNVPNIEKVIGIYLVFSQLCNKIFQFIKSAHADRGPRFPCSLGMIKIGWCTLEGGEIFMFDQIS